MFLFCDDFSCDDLLVFHGPHLAVVIRHHSFAMGSGIIGLLVSSQVYTIEHNQAHSPSGTLPLETVLLEVLPQEALPQEVLPEEGIL